MASPSELNINTTLGAVLIGFAVACCVYGILFAQVFSYFSRFPFDRPVYKGLVLLILLLETTDQAFIGHVVYHYTISNFANVLALAQGTVTWSFILQQTIGAVVGCMILRVASVEIEHNKFITGIILLLTYGQLGLAIAFTLKAFQLTGVFEVIDLRALGSTSLGVGVLTDVVTAASLCYFLNKLRTGYHKSDSLVNSLVLYAINTGALTSAVSLSTVIFYNIMRANLVFVASFFILSKLYAISFMATLNTRRIVRGKGTDKQGTTTNNTNLFHLGTRMPSMGHIDVDQWDNSPVSPTSKDPSNEFPFDSYYYPQKAVSNGVAV
ncbi:uncharacterized protein BT62DRAFT_1006510 [Guyanagaster necrorhizus]|uniref:DUF6534 domain-containing protein n=1 Tax=Guyanagaster necrorhizus TaxID=856835 RepID=A0A9P7VRK5_9AGAR|nr:uncharacterized protein BT62DRAFT_1006510 [Guyanagaster necrorhizus MCA 3950]KAG7445532.1 hypothetical protein BT62DRAFT_1006510 [Guyanagaster necrorhizus MCA 3950]